jgi:hypothetical protein
MVLRLEEIEEEAFEAMVTKGNALRIANYIDLEELVLLKAHERISLGVVSDNDQTDIKYWQGIEDMFHHDMPIPPTRT